MYMALGVLIHIVIYQDGKEKLLLTAPLMSKQGNNPFPGRNKSIVCIKVQNGILILEIGLSVV